MYLRAVFTATSLLKILNIVSKNKRLNIYAYVLMTNHLHMVANVDEGSLSDILRDFKTYTSKEIIKLISNNPSESRRVWLLNVFEFSGKQNPLNKNHQFWQMGIILCCCIQMMLFNKR